MHKVISKVKIEYLSENDVWTDYDAGNYVETGQTGSTATDTKLIIQLTKYEAKSVRIIIDAGGTTDACVGGRFDLRIYPIYYAMNQLQIECQERNTIFLSENKQTTDICRVN